MAFPMLAGLKKLYPDVCMDMAIKKSFAGLGELLPFIDNTFELPYANSPQQKYDTALILPNSFRSAWEMWRACAKERIGYAGEFRSMLLTKPIRKPESHSLHQIEYFNNLARSAFPNFEAKEVAMKVPDTFDLKAKKLIGETKKPVVGIGFGATYGSAKMWPAERFAKLIDALSEEANVFLIGAKSDREVEQAVMAQTKSQPKSLVGLTDIPTLAGVLSHLDLYITNDTGPLHLASAVGANVLVIFGPTDPNETKPPGDNVTLIYNRANCAPCWKRLCPTDHRCMTEITVDEVFHSARLALDLR
ncbi:ADP-heptose--lipooligosaccharide heptosyltransferase II [hydrothermal vent metagenome]|uniref:lipopolysaccharide heptosyltransferase II n=1 Tax=hydrothermal vent metagenome TaxID=652676 RepID=A0A3B1BUJ3_9ZZZZ